MPTVKVLVIDGSHSARYRLRIALRHAGAEITTAASIEESLHLLRHPKGPARPDAVFANRILPGMNGLELVDLLQLDPATAALPVVLTGVDEQWPLRALALERGAAALLPADPDAAALGGVLAQVRAGWVPPVWGAPAMSGGLSRPSASVYPSPPQRRYNPSRHLPLGLLIAGTCATVLAVLLHH